MRQYPEHRPSLDIPLESPLFLCLLSLLTLSVRVEASLRPLGLSGKSSFAYALPLTRVTYLT